LPGFKFKLQTLLHLKSKMEDNLINELAGAINKLNIEKNILNNIFQKKESLINDMNNSCISGISVLKLNEYNMYINKIYNDIKLQKESIKKEEETVDIIRGKLLEVVKERKILEKLKEKKYREYRKEIIKKEQLQLDEVSIQRFTNDKNI
jgi:flagellar protein FliJ